MHSSSETPTIVLPSLRKRFLALWREKAMGHWLKVLTLAYTTFVTGALLCIFDVASRKPQPDLVGGHPDSPISARESLEMKNRVNKRRQAMMKYRVFPTRYHSGPVCAAPIVLQEILPELIETPELEMPSISFDLTGKQSKFSAIEE